MRDRPRSLAPLLVNIPYQQEIWFGYRSSVVEDGGGRVVEIVITVVASSVEIVDFPSSSCVRLWAVFVLQGMKA